MRGNRNWMSAREALLESDLHHALGIAHRGDQRRAFFDRVRDGLLAVDVFAGAHTGDGDGHVPVVGRGDHDGVDILTVEDLAVVEVGERVGGGVLGFGFQAARFINVAAGDDLVLFGELQLAQQILAASAGADGADPYAIVGAEDSAIGRRGNQRSAHKLSAMMVHSRTGLPACPDRPGGLSYYR